MGSGAFCCFGLNDGWRSPDWPARGVGLGTVGIIGVMGRLEETLRRIGVGLGEAALGLGRWDAEVLRRR